MPPPRLNPSQTFHLRSRLPCSRLQHRIWACRSYASSPPAESQTAQSPEIPTLPWKTPHSITAWPPEPLIPPPKDGELLLERRPNRALPPIPPLIPKQITQTMPIFIIVLTASILAFFNYQKTESSVVTSTLYALRTNPSVRSELGDEIYFASKYPWIKGEINQVHGRIDISFWVKGTRRTGEVRLRCRRRGRGGYFVTQEWSLTLEDGRVLQLYDPEGDAVDPFAETGEELDMVV